LSRTFISRRSLLILMFGLLILSTGCTSAPAPNFVLVQQPHIIMQPGVGATDVNPTSQIWVTVRGGTFNTVGLTNPAGKAVMGKLSTDRTIWTVGEPLGYDKTYTWSGMAVDSAGVQIPVRGSFHTLNPTEQISAKLNVADHATYGIAMPIALTFSSPIRDKAAVERSLSVQTSVPTEGSWAWLDDKTVHWRPQTFFTPNTDVTVTARLYGLSMGSGAYGRDDLSAKFTIGRSYVLKGDTQTHRLMSYANGVQVVDYPASYGFDSDPRRVTRSGIHVVMAKFPTFFMSNPKFDYYNEAYAKLNLG